MSETVKKGTIKAIVGNVILVEISTCSACASCAIKSACNLSESTNKIVEIPVDDVSLYNIGDHLEISLTSTQGLIAIWLGFGIPLLLLLLTLIFMVWAGFNEIISSISGIIILIPYYFGLFLSRNKLENKFRCSVKQKLEETNE